MYLLLRSLSLERRGIAGNDGSARAKMRDLRHSVGKLSLLLLVDGRRGGQDQRLVGQRGSGCPGGSKVRVRCVVLRNVLGLSLGEVQGGGEGSIKRMHGRRGVDRRGIGEVALEELGLRVIEVEVGGKDHAEILDIVDRRLGLSGESVLSLVLLLAFYRAVERRVKGLGRKGRLESVALSLCVDDGIADGAVVVEAVHVWLRVFCVEIRVWCCR